MHGWGDSPSSYINSPLVKALEQNGFKVVIPQVKNSLEPAIEDWVGTLAKAVDVPDEETYFFGHSLGCQAILRYLQTLPEKTKIGKVTLVAAGIKLSQELIDDPESEPLKPWLTTSINFKKIKSHLTKITGIFSDDDPVIPLENSEILEKELNAKIIIQKNKGHFTMFDGVLTNKIILEEAQAL